MAVKRRACSRCERNRAERFFTSPRGRVCTDCQKKKRRVTARKQHVSTTYHLTEAEHSALLAAQNHGCAICGRKPRYSLEVDHDHRMERFLLEGGSDPHEARWMSIRGLLCKPCNRRLLPAARDNETVLRAAANYVSLPPAWKTLKAPLEDIP